jgi:hypothetical protein
MFKTHAGDQATVNRAKRTYWKEHGEAELLSQVQEWAEAHPLPPPQDGEYVFFAMRAFRNEQMAQDWCKEELMKYEPFKFVQFAIVPVGEWIRVADKDSPHAPRLYREERQTAMAQAQRREALRAMEVKAEAQMKGKHVVVTEIAKDSVQKHVVDFHQGKTQIKTIETFQKELDEERQAIGASSPTGEAEAVPADPAEARRVFKEKQAQKSQTKSAPKKAEALKAESEAAAPALSVREGGFRVEDFSSYADLDKK